MLLEMLLILIALAAYLVMKDRRPANIPPGPPEIPFLGGVPITTVKKMEQYRKTYGNIFTTRLGAVRNVIVSDYKTAKEAMANPDFADRPHHLHKLHLNQDASGGVAFENGSQWVHDRRFVLRNLRDLGMGKTYLEQAVQQEAQALVDDLKTLGSEPSPYPRSLRTSVLNVIWQMISGKRYDFGSIEVDRIFTLFEKTQAESLGIFLESFFPIIRFLPTPLKRRILKPELINELQVKLKTIIKDLVSEHEQQLDVECPRDLIDEYLVAMKADDSSEMFSRDALCQIACDMFAAGSDTMNATLKFVILYMVQYPTIRRRCQEEIDKVVPVGSLVSVLHRQELPYVEAFVAEMLRCSSLIFMGLPRVANKDTKLAGYFIPEGTFLNTNAYFIHHDPDFWDEPDKFNPDRFIDEDGKFQSKLGRSFAFGSGRRQCVGESLARMEVYLFTAALLQNFDIDLPTGETLDTSVPEGAFFTRTPADQKFVYKPRF